MKSFRFSSKNRFFGWLEHFFSTWCNNISWQGARNLSSSLRNSAAAVHGSLLFFFPTFWYFVSKIVLTYCEKNCFVIEKNFWISRLEVENFQKTWDHLLKQWKVRTIFDTECFFNLFLEVSQIWYIRKIQIQIGKNNWNSETYRKS